MRTTQLPLSQFGLGEIRVVIDGPSPEPGKREVVEFRGEAVIMSITSPEDLIKNRGMIQTLVVGPSELLPFIAQGLGAVLVMNNLLTPLFTLLITKFNKEYLAASLEAISIIQSQGVPHDDTEGSD